MLRLQAAWQRWELSNFEYLMCLNSLAGRTLNDLNAYPVMPWVLQDYASATLDLSDPASYRDLATPIGALNEKRLEFFVERYHGMQGDPHMPPFHYGSHYSSAGIVLFYLMRLEPFTRLYRALQGGRFDVADRLFHTMAATWDNVLEVCHCLYSRIAGSAGAYGGCHVETVYGHPLPTSSPQNTSDVKELIPEFYYQPEFLLNSNRFHFGIRQVSHSGIRSHTTPPFF